MQVILWTDQRTLKNPSVRFHPGVELKDVTEVIPLMTDCDIMAKLKNVAAVSDLMRYEVGQVRLLIIIHFC